MQRQIQRSFMKRRKERTAALIGSAEIILREKEEDLMGQARIVKSKRDIAEDMLRGISGETFF